ncbi:MAG: PH domain-containing protein [Sporichthyaceae bacterium]
MNRPLGLGPIPAQTISAPRQLIVRQAAALCTGVFLFLTMGGLAAGVLAEPGETLGSGNEFLDRFVWGILIVPVLYGAERFFLRTRVIVEESGVTVHNPWQTAVLPWSSVGGAGFDRSFTVVLSGGDRLRSMLFGQAFSSQLTRRTRVDELIAVVNEEAARRAGRRHDPEAAYSAEALVGTVGSGAPDVEDADSKWVYVYGWQSFAIYAVLWTVICAVVAATS